MISKELLSEVLQNYNIEHFEIDDNYLWIQVDGGYLNKTINIYELAHKCKEWAYNTTGMAVWSTVLLNGSKSEVFKTAYMEKDFYSATESVSIFKACEWILKNK